MSILKKKRKVLLKFSYEYNMCAMIDERVKILFLTITVLHVQIIF